MNPTPDGSVPPDPHDEAMRAVRAAVDLIEVSASDEPRWCKLIAERLVAHLTVPGPSTSAGTMTLGGVCLALQRPAPAESGPGDVCAAAGLPSAEARSRAEETWIEAMQAGHVNGTPLTLALTRGSGWCAALAHVRGHLSSIVIGVQALGSLATSGRRLESLMPAIESSYWRCIGRLSTRRQALLQRLSDAPRRVVELLADGLTEREIAGTIKKSHHTVHDHVKTIYAAIGATKRAELIRYWHGVDETKA